VGNVSDPSDRLRSVLSLRLKPDRRIRRLPNPPCRHCQTSKHVTVVCREPPAIFFGCAACGHIQQQPGGRTTVPETFLHCPRCGSEYVLRSHTRWWQWPRRWLTDRRP